ncbi:Gfo/Idh/MocA family oxidoreductase [Asaia sp. HN128]
MRFPVSLPEPDCLAPSAIPALRWGVIGPGWIAERFVQSVQRFTNQKIMGIESRDGARAAAFARRFDIPHSFDGAMSADPRIDALYIATPHPFHFEMARRAIEAGKPVLVEKPLCVSAAEARELVELARARHVFLMEAYWTDFLPKFSVLRKVLAEGLIGEIVTVMADHGEFFPPEHRIMRADLGGGPMLDLGTYVIGLATGILGRPDQVMAHSTRAESGVDGQTGMLFQYRGGAQAVLHTSLLSHTPCGAVIAGREGMITLAGKFYTPGPFVLSANDPSRTLTFDEPRSAYDGLHFQVEHMAWCLGQGMTQSPIRPLSASLLALETMDRARAAGHATRADAPFA